MTITAACLVFGAFVLGSFPTGVLIARACQVDLRKVGSGNVGATNVGRALGRRWAVVVLLVDALKGFLPVFVGQRLQVPPLVIAVTGLAAVVGHMFSVFLKGRGGKGVATSLGAALALDPLIALAAAGVYAILFAALRISSVGSLAAVSAFPLLLWLHGDRERAHFLFAGVVAVLVIVRHRDNIRRLVRGEEHKA
jgi:glycerol-3-phosphate acyltransferase PlsY